MTAALEVVELGVATTIQDAGRPGFAHLGVSPSGAIDPTLFRLVNRLVGNPPDAAVFETCGGLRLRAHGIVHVATSAEVAPRTLADGDEIMVPARPDRIWHYLAACGGIDTEVVLGSRSFDTMSGLGTMLEAGRVVNLGTILRSPSMVDVAPLPPLGSSVRLLPGPRGDWVDESTAATLTTTAWTVSTRSRVGVRLAGAQLQRRIADELPSEGLVRGAIQVPPDGNPVMMLADHPTTGGYPVIAVVHPEDVALVAQHAAGGTLRFRDEPVE